MSDTNEGLSLHDISGFGEDVSIGNAKLRVKGISAYGVLLLLRRYPDVLGGWLAGRNIALAEIMLQGPDVVAAIIAAGTGSPGDTDAEDTAASLPVEAQIEILEAVYRQSFRSGFGPFVERVQKMFGGLGIASGTKDPDTKSPQESSASLQPDIPPNEPGPTPPAK